MATLTYSDLIAVFPELATVDAAALTRIGFFLDIAEQTIGSDGFETTTKRDRCRLCVAAHLTALSNADTCSSSNGARSGAVTGRTRGSRSVSYAAPRGPIGRLELDSTRYGQIARLLLVGGRHQRGVVG